MPLPGRRSTARGRSPSCAPGLWRIRERWEAALGTSSTSAILGDARRASVEIDAPGVAPRGRLRGPLIVARSDFAPAGTRMSLGAERPPAHCPGRHGRVDRSRRASAGTPTSGGAVAGDRRHPPARDLRPGHGAGAAARARLRRLPRPVPPTHCPPRASCWATRRACAATGAEVEPGVVFDVRHGVDRASSGVPRCGAARGSRAPAMSGRAPGCWAASSARRSSGPRSVVRGEVSSSDLPRVRQQGRTMASSATASSATGSTWARAPPRPTSRTPTARCGSCMAGTRIETGRQFLGSLIGDHAKTAIGTMLPTGTVVGAGANVFGDGLGKYVPPFSWGASGDVAAHRGGLPPHRRAGHAAPRRGGDRRAPRVAHRDLPPTVRR